MKRWTTGIAVAAGLLLAPLAALAGDVEDQLQQMQQKLEALEQRLDATTDNLEAAQSRVEQQEELIRSSGIADARGASSGLASFLETLEVGGWVSATYFYNFNDPDGETLGGANTSTGGLMYPFHPDANSFALDQLWFELERPVSPEHRAGFRADLVFGKTADLLSDFSQDGISGSQEDLQIYQGYVQYLADIGSGVTFQMGKFATLLGAEVAQSPYNWNITRGNLYNMFQPFTHVGVLASAENDGASIALGAVNTNVGTRDIDVNNNKSVIWHVGYGQDMWSAAFNGVWGSSESSVGGTALESDKEIILDALLTFDPTDTFSAWVNANWRDVDLNQALGTNTNVNGWGVAAAGRVALTEKMGFAVRGEYIDDSDGAFSGFGASDTEIWGVTGTMDYSLTEQLMVRAEVRWDQVDNSGVSDNVFFSDGTDDGLSGEDDQIVAGVEVLYSF